MPAIDAPLILTLSLDERTFGYFNALRQKHFPPERNYLDAHFTLFHHLPGPAHDDIAAVLVARAQAQRPMPMRVTGLQFLGRGVAFALDAPEAEALHRELQALWRAHLTPQDQQRRRPHVTIQNKVTPAAARALHEQLSAGFEPFEATGTGLQLWAYRNGPWELLRSFAFGA
ncbi:2'-5' RNA ligase family protein [Hymenobacter latericus]|uniref:2'-5' RNA ligase family protein n=1 Tax=Hymenobacter sp. YIM 151858-1 TaxID=2987688 RepID=UPI00222698F5|nr:2'-5' RNA ligase family protein [Hymenobacter sp. YIM 151858-1]UYZ60734.1 2'-5' RNA ligase family protein [Hymenobacter sp. YIM 151858-1]